MEEKARTILEKHGCELICMLSESRVLWKNRNGIIRDDDVATLFHMTETVWQYWEHF